MESAPQRKNEKRPSCQTCSAAGMHQPCEAASTGRLKQRCCRADTDVATGEGLDANYLRNTKGSSVDTEAIAREHPEGDGQDLERPRFHVMSRRGWTSDPCGPMYHNGKCVLPPRLSCEGWHAFLCSCQSRLSVCP